MPPALKKVAPKLLHLIAEPALPIALDEIHKLEQGQKIDPPLAKKPKDLSAGEDAGFVTDIKSAEFLEALLTPTEPVQGEEGIFDNLGDMLTQALSVAKPLVKAGLTTLADLMPESAMGPTPTEHESIRICDRHVRWRWYGQ